MLSVSSKRWQIFKVDKTTQKPFDARRIDAKHWVDAVRKYRAMLGEPAVLPPGGMCAFGDNGRVTIVDQGEQIAYVLLPEKQLSQAPSSAPPPPSRDPELPNPSPRHTHPFTEGASKAQPVGSSLEDVLGQALPNAKPSGGHEAVSARPSLVVAAKDGLSDMGFLGSAEDLMDYAAELIEDLLKPQGIVAYLYDLNDNVLRNVREPAAEAVPAWRGAVSRAVTLLTVLAVEPHRDPHHDPAVDLLGQLVVTAPVHGNDQLKGVIQAAFADRSVMADAVGIMEVVTTELGRQIQRVESDQ